MGLAIEEVNNSMLLKKGYSDSSVEQINPMISYMING